MEEFTYLEIVDLDESRANRLVTQTIPDTKSFCKCPHHIVEKVIKIVDEQVQRHRKQEEPKLLQKTNDNFKMLNTRHDTLVTLMKEMKAKMDNLENANVHKF